MRTHQLFFKRRRFSQSTRCLSDSFCCWWVLLFRRNV